MNLQNPQDTPPVRKLPEKLIVSSSPHIKGDDSTSTIMADVIIALMPALAWAIYIFGFRALTHTLISVISCVVFEAAAEYFFRRRVTVKDLSAVLTGILIAFNIPVNAPLWITIAGGAFAMIIVKGLFGGLGKNMVNPAIAARIFMFMSFPSLMSSFADISVKLSPFTVNVDAVTSATPLTFLKHGEFPDTQLFEMFLGQTGGSIGEISGLLLLVGGLYLLFKRVISWHIPVTFIGTVAVLTYFFSRNTQDLQFMLYEVLSGGLILGALFMATDYVTSPFTKLGKLIFGVACGLITVFIRYFGGYPEGVSFAIMIMNLFVWYLDTVTKPVKFGGVPNAKPKQ